MENSNQLNFVTKYSGLPEDPDKEFLKAVKEPDLLKVQGTEGLSISENFNLFFKEFSNSIDKRLVALGKSVHVVDFANVQKYLNDNRILYVKNTGVEILTPEGYSPGFGNMQAHAKAVTEGIYLINSLRTESSRLYDWIKEIIKRGRIDRSFQWTITDFDRAVDKTENFLKNLPEDTRRKNFTIGQVYVNFDEAFGIMGDYNTLVKTFKHREVEMTAKELSNVYELGQLLIKKIQTGDILISQESITDIEFVINNFVKLSNICGSIMVLLNELTAVFNSQLATFNKLK